MLFHFLIAVMGNFSPFLLMFQIIARFLCQIFHTVKTYQVFPFLKIKRDLRLIICHQKSSCPQYIPYAERNPAFNIGDREVQVYFRLVEHFWHLAPIIDRAAVLHSHKIRDIAVTVHIHMEMF